MEPTARECTLCRLLDSCIEDRTCLARGEPFSGKEQPCLMCYMTHCTTCRQACATCAVCEQIQGVLALRGSDLSSYGWLRVCAVLLRHEAKQPLVFITAVLSTMPVSICLQAAHVPFSPGTDRGALVDGVVGGRLCAVLLGHGGWQLGKANGALREMGVELGEEILGQVCGGVLGPVDAPVVAHKLLPRHLLLYLRTDRQD